MATTETGYVPPGHVQDTNQAISDLKHDLARTEDRILATIRHESGRTRLVIAELDVKVDKQLSDIHDRWRMHDRILAAILERLDRIDERLT